MNLDKALLAILLAMLAVIGVAFLIPEEPGGQGITHPEFTTMQRGGPGPERHERILWVGWFFGFLQMLLCVGLMAFGARKAGLLRGAGGPLLGCAALQITIWTCLVLAYRGFMHGGGRALFLALPAPTAVLMYGLWPVAIVFTLCFVIGFKRWVLSDEDLAAFERLVTERRRRMTGSLDGAPPGGRSGEEKR
jgi:hypothetical protein